MDNEENIYYFKQHIRMRKKKKTNKKITIRKE